MENMDTTVVKAYKEVILNEKRLRELEQSNDYLLNKLKDLEEKLNTLNDSSEDDIDNLMNY
ncbi:MAG: hypothetical protein HG467_000445 [Clostridiales bacterium]|nr:hypothetical protein [Clostridiales bacterium]